MFGTIGKPFATAVVAAGLIAGAAGGANAAIIGSASYDNVALLTNDPNPASLTISLDSSVVTTIATPTVGSTIALSTFDPTAFASIAAVLRNNIDNLISVTAFGIETTVGDFDYSPPPTDDLQGSGAITEIFVTINELESLFVDFGFVQGYLTQYEIDIDVESIPVPGALVSAVSGFALLGLVARRRKRLC